MTSYMTYECDNDNHDIGCQCPGIPPMSDRLIAVLKAESERVHAVATELTKERGKHHAYIFGEASGLRRAIEIIKAL